MKNFKLIYTSVLLLSLTVTLFSACKSDKTDLTTTAQNTQPASTKIHATDYTYKPILTETKENETKYVHTVPPIPTDENKTEKKTGKIDQTNKKTDTTTGKITSNEKIEDLSKDLSLITKTSPVMKGNSATIIIQGTPDAKYSIEFYKNNTSKADYQGLDEIRADSSGFASWTFTVENDCEIGDRKIIVREKNSNKFIQTSITVQ